MEVIVVQLINLLYSSFTPYNIPTFFSVTTPSKLKSHHKAKKAPKKKWLVNLIISYTNSRVQISEGSCNINFNAIIHCH